MSEKMHFCAFIMATGHHIASWRYPGVPLENGTNFQYWANLARIAERGKLDAIFLYDGAAISNIPLAPMAHTDRATFFDPMTLLPALAMVTSKIGLVSTSSTTYDQPFYVARRYLSLDHLSGGRAGWNMVTGVNVREALNFGTAAMAHDERYVRAREFAEVVLALWDSWADDAFIMDKESSHFFDPAKVQSLDHTGKYFTCAGPMCVARSPQGRPVMVQAGGSEPGKELAAETAEMVYTVQSDFETGREFYADLKGRMAKFGREPHELKVMPGVYTIVGRSEQEAEDIYGELRELVDEEVAKATLGLCLGGADLSLLPFDGPVPTGLSTNAGTTHLKTMIKIAQDRNLSLRELAMDVAAGGYGHWTVRGTPKQIADQLEERFRGGAADGFNLMPATLPGGLEDFIDLVLPELRRRGLFRTEYDGSTLRDHLGLKHPARRIAKPLSSPARAVA
jgi:FMN-dependent oxidoreductase (nitrilotriacetate monooxygenase family)